MKRLILLFTLGVAISACSQPTASKVLSPQLIGAEQFQEEIKKNNVTIIDVRTPQEFNEGYIRGAINIDYKSATFEDDIKKLDKEHPILLYCLGGGRSAAAAEILTNNGFEVIELEGGIMNWKNNDFPLVGYEAKDDESINYTALINQEGIVVIDFYADWCAPCKRMKPSLEKLDNEIGVKVIRIDADKNPALCKQENITALPVLKYYKKGQLLKVQEGFIGEKELFETVNSLK